nr:hypothetical protein [Pseudomonas sp.]
MGSALDAVIGNPPGESKAMVGFAPEKIPLENFLFLQRKHEMCHFLIRAQPLGETTGRHPQLLKTCTTAGQSALRWRTWAFFEERS